MKKIIICAAALISVLGMSASALEINKPVVTDEKISITGKTDNANEFAALIVLKPDTATDNLTQAVMDANTVYAKQIKSNADGKFAVEFILPDECAENKNYSVAVFSGDKKEISQFYYIKQSGLNVILDKFNDHTDTVKNLLTYYSVTEPALNVVLDTFYDANEDAINAVFEKNRINLNSFTTLAQIETAYSEACAVVRINAATDTAAMTAEIDAHKDVFGFETDAAYTCDKANLSQLMISYRGAGFDSSNDVRAAYKQAYITAVTNAETDATKIDSWMVKNAAMIGINAATYQQYISPTVGSIIAGRSNYTGYTDISAAVTAAMTTLDSKKTNTSTTVSGGGGGVSKGGVFAPVTNVPTITPEDNDVFSDMSAAEWAKKAVTELYKKGIVSGKGNGEFKPNEDVLREEFITMAVKAMGLQIGGTCTFEDVPNDSWFAPYVSAAVNSGIVSGRDEKHFGAGQTVTRQEMAAILYRCAAQNGINLPERRDTASFTDAEQIADYAKNAVDGLYRAEIISGMGDGTFGAEMSSTRAQAAQMIYGFMQLL